MKSTGMVRGFRLGKSTCVSVNYVYSLLKWKQQKLYYFCPFFVVVKMWSHVTLEKQSASCPNQNMSCLMTDSKALRLNFSLPENEI